MNIGTAVISKGDATPCGGEVSQGSTTYIVRGKQVSLEGHLVWCKAHQSTYPLIGGHATFKHNDRKIAVVSTTRVTCPGHCSIMQHQLSREVFSYGGAGSTDNPYATSSHSQPRSPTYNQHFQLVDQNDQPLKGVKVSVQSSVSSAPVN
jgi:uncharacterized Zn-binding protein involved in type VI secretion